MPFLVTCMPDGAARSLGAKIATIDTAIPGINAPPEVVPSFLHAYEQNSPFPLRRQAKLHVTLISYEVENLIQPQTAPEGSWRVGTMEDIDALTEYMEIFGVEVDLPVSHRGNERNYIQGKIHGGMMYIWCDETGEIAAFASHAPPVDSPAGRIGRIGPVFTVAKHRCKGFGGAITAVVAKSLLDQGIRVMLNADESNPASNSVYQRLGFQNRGYLAEYTFVDI